MYAPMIYRGTERAEVLEILRAYPFATLTARCGDRLCSAHLPFVVDEGEGGEIALRGHLASDNELIEHIAGEELLAHFHGPQAYISPADYSHEGHFPTWIYVAVHVYGRARLLDAGELHDQLVTLIAQQERAERPGSSWHIGLMPAELTEHLKQFITGFEIRVDSIESCFRLNQNKPRPDLEAMARSLAARDGRQPRALARLLLRHADRIDPDAMSRHVAKYRP